MKPLPLDIARAAARRMAQAANVTLIEPDDPVRTVIAAAVYAGHKVGGGSWTHAHVTEHISVTLPGAGPALGLLRAVPTAGPLLAAAGEAAGLGRTVVSIAPSTWQRPVELVGTMRHELGHVGDIAAGGLPWCLVYLLWAEARAGGEAPCYGASMAVQVALGGLTPGQAAQRARDSLRGYKLDGDATALAARIIRVHERSLEAGDDPGGVLADTFRALAAEGWTP